jgi:hypothetical protein
MKNMFNHINWLVFLTELELQRSWPAADNLLFIRGLKVSIRCVANDVHLFRIICNIYLIRVSVRHSRLH